MRRSYPFEADEATLRQFGRVLTGSQTAAEVFAHAAREAMTAAPHWFHPAPTARVALIRTLMGIWNDGWAGETGRARRAFLLAALEGLPAASIGPALGCSESMAEALIARAIAEIGEKLGSHVLILTSPVDRSRWLVALLESLGHTVLGPARTSEEAVQLAASVPPGLILADMPRADGEAVPRIVDQILARAAAPVILIGADTATGTLVRAKVPVVIVAEPVDADRVTAAVWLALLIARQDSNQPDGETSLEGPAP